MSNNVSILLNEISKLNKFVSIVTKYEEDVDVIKNKYVIDGKSVMGLFSLDLSKPVFVRVNAEDDDILSRFYSEMKEFEI